MFNAVVLAVGTLREPLMRQAVFDYLKRIAPYSKVEMAELKAEPFRDAAGMEKAKKKEGERILEFLKKKPGAKTILLKENGKEYDSREFAEFLSETNQRILFVIGGTSGFSKEILDRRFTTLSLSRMTLTHEMARILLLEQIYRAATLLKGKVYHY